MIIAQKHNQNECRKPLAGIVFEDELYEVTIATKIQMALITTYKPNFLKIVLRLCIGGNFVLVIFLIMKQISDNRKSFTLTKITPAIDLFLPRHLSLRESNTVIYVMAVQLPIF